MPGRWGNDDPDTLAAMRSLGSLCLADGKWAEAESLLTPAMQGLRQLRGPEHPDTLTAMDAVAQLYLNRGANLPEAESLTSQVRGVLLRTRGATDLKTLDATNSLALILHAQNKSEEAERLLQNVVGQLREKMAADHPLTLIAMHNLAMTYDGLGRKIEAERLLNEVLDRQKTVLGKKHPHALLTMVRLAFLYLGQNQPDEAQPLFIEALEGCRAALDRNHETAEGALAGLADVYARKRDLGKLGPVLIEARDIQFARYGPDDGVTAGGNEAVGLFFLVQGQYSKAEPYFRDRLAFSRKNHSQEPERHLAELRLGVCVLAQKKCKEARPLLVSAYNGLKPSDKHAIPASTSDLGWIVGHIKELRDEAGQPMKDASLRQLRGDPVLEDIIMDLEFPASPFEAE